MKVVLWCCLFVVIFIQTKQLDSGPSIYLCEVQLESSEHTGLHEYEGMLKVETTLQPVHCEPSENVTGKICIHFAWFGILSITLTAPKPLLPH